MASFNDNAAYDLSLFEPKESPKVPEKPKKKEKKAVAARPAVHPAIVIRWVAAAGFIMLSLLAIMLCNVQLTDLSDQITTEKTQLQNAQSENVRLNMQLESRMSLDNVQNYATGTLGMQKTNPSQINYVHLTDQDQVDVTHHSANIFARLYNLILEYL